MFSGNTVKVPMQTANALHVARPACDTLSICDRVSCDKRCWKTKRRRHKIHARFVLVGCKCNLRVKFVSCHRVGCVDICAGSFMVWPSRIGMAVVSWRQLLQAVLHGAIVAGATVCFDDCMGRYCSSCRCDGISHRRRAT